MVIKLANAIKENHSTTYEVGKYIADYIADKYTVIDESDIAYFLDNLRIFNSTYETAEYEMYERSMYSLVRNMDNPIGEKHVGDSMLKAWLKDQDYHNLDIKDNDIWFTIYE